MLKALESTLGLAQVLRNASISHIFIAVCTILVTRFITKGIYQIWFHPLSHFPGPKLSAFTRIPYVKARYTGQQHKYIAKIHREYGPIVRLMPDELSFIDPQAWKDIYGHGVKGIPMPSKPWTKYGVEANGVPNLTQNRDNDHTRVRRIFNPAFSDRALKQQEPLFTKYVDQLVRNLKGRIDEDPNTKVDLVRYYNFTTFDVMGDLTFGEPLHMLDNAEYDPWVKIIFRSVKFATRISLLQFYPIVDRVFKALIPESFAKEQKFKHFNFSVQRVTKRLERGRDTEGVDLWDLVLRQKEGEGLSRNEMDSNAGLFMIAGTETTATLVSGLTYLLLKNQEKFKNLTEEIRSTFASSEDVSMEAIAGLPYLNACIKEALRLYPPVAVGLPRETPPQGCTICGEYVPPGFIVSVPHHAMYTSERNFKDPLQFIPERWLGDERFATDQRQTVQPFSVGPRDCLGKNMAYHEMRLIMSKMIYNFDLELSPECDQWSDQEVYVLWQKTPLMVRFKVAQPS